MPAPILERINSGVLVLDGAMGSQMQNRPLTVEGDYDGCENCTDVLVRTRGDLVREIHELYLAAGADAVETNTFGAMPHVLREFGLEDESGALNRRACELARAACEAAGGERFVIGSMGPGTKLITLGQISWDELYGSYRTAAKGLLEGGVDALLLETCQDPLQVKCAISAMLDELDARGMDTANVPLMVNVTIETTGTMLVGASIESAAATLRGYPIATLGLNCATGPTEMHEHLAWLSRHWEGELAVLPNAGLPVLVEGRTEYPLRPGPFAEAMRRFIEDLGVRVVGGCCGTTDKHIAELRRVVDASTPGERAVEPLAPGSSSLYQPVEHRQDNSLLLVGERCNASGSRKFKRLLEAEDWDGVVSLAREQVRESSHLLDVNVDYAGRDNAADMGEVVSRLATQVDAPLMLDSTQAGTIEAGLRRAPGKCVINSANFEDGDEKFDHFCSLAKRYNAALVIGTIDEDPEEAMARTAERKLEIATRAIGRATEVHGLAIDDIFIDPLVLPVSTGMDTDRRSALELIEGCRLIAARFPRVQMTCGLSNASFGLRPAARHVLNSVLLHALTEAGLTSAIVHASKIVPLSKIECAHRDAALDVIYDRRAEAIGGTGLPARPFVAAAPVGVGSEA
ncbi:MAG: homocysteine S-methyltransferase family protein [Planctomycetota bacterium]